LWVGVWDIILWGWEIRERDGERERRLFVGLVGREGNWDMIGVGVDTEQIKDNLECAFRLLD
jgi:hypothetical protein